MSLSRAADRFSLTVALAGGMLSGPAISGAQAQTVIDSWKSVAIPPPPELQPVTVDAEHTALLILDVNADACSRRPSCVRSIPHMQHVLADARAHHMFVVYSTSASAPSAPVPEPLAPIPNDLSVSSSADKFLGTDLEKILASRGIKTVIVVGTTAQGAVLYTASAAALRKLAVVVPVDGYSSDTPFAELVTAWLLKNAPVSVSAHVTLTRTDMITVHDASPPEQAPSGRKQGLNEEKREKQPMKRAHVFVTLTTIVALNLISAAPSIAQDEPRQGQGQGPRPLDPSIKTTFVPLGNGEPGVLYEPKNPGPKAQIAILAEHSALDYLTHSSCTELSKRGYRVFCVNNSNDKSRAFNDGSLDQVMLETKKAIVYLRKYPGVKKIVLWGHSGGASVMTAYQDTAENGVAACQEAVKIYKCPNSLAELPPADGIILGDANWGIANDVLTAIDPSVAMDDGMKITDPGLNMFDPKNGFNSAGSHFSPEFVHKFLAAQGKRNNEMVNLALKKYAEIKAGKGTYSDDEMFVIAGALFTQNKLYTSDMNLLAHTQKPWPLLHADGSITNEIVHSVRVPTATANTSHSLLGAALKTTVLGYLSTYAIRVTDDYGYGEETAETGVIWRSSRGSNPGNVEGITVPFLTMAMTGSFEMGSAETIHNHVKGADKSLVYIEGATHTYTPCKPCEKTPGQFGDTVKTVYDYADNWLSKPGRFM